MKKISIIIPARNEEAYLARTLQGIENQDYPHYETIVVANGCTDNTAAVAAKYADKVYSLRQPGVGQARNFGAARAKGDLLVFLDADTVLEKDVLGKIAKRFKLKYSSGTVKVRPDIPKFHYKLMMGFKNLVNSLGVYPWVGGVVFCRKDDFPGFNENLYVREHYFLIQELKKKGRFYFLDDTHVKTSMRRYERWGSLKLVLFFIGKGIKNFYSKIEGDKYPVIR